MAHRLDGWSRGAARPWIDSHRKTPHEWQSRNEAWEWIREPNDPAGWIMETVPHPVVRAIEARVGAALNNANAEVRRLTEVALFLFDRLDDIDTMDDAAKGNDAAYRVQVRRIQRRRFEVGSVSGEAGETVTFRAPAALSSED